LEVVVRCSVRVDLGTKYIKDGAGGCRKWMDTCIMYVLYMSQGKWGKYGNNTRRLTYEIT